METAGSDPQETLCENLEFLCSLYECISAVAYSERGEKRVGSVVFVPHFGGLGVPNLSSWGEKFRQ